MDRLLAFLLHIWQMSFLGKETVVKKIQVIFLFFFDIANGILLSSGKSMHDKWVHKEFRDQYFQSNLKHILLYFSG